MLKANLYSLFVILAFLSQASAEEENVSVVKRPSEVYEGSSDAMRMNKSYTATLGLTGVSSGYGPGTGLSVGYHLSRNQIILLDFRSGEGANKRSSSYSYGSGYSSSASTDVKVTQVGAHYKQFFGNSFYIRGGVDYSQVKYNYKWNYYSGYSSRYNDQTDYGFDGYALLGNISIGNQWQWDNFTLGCDWFGLSQSLAHKMTREEISSNAASYDRDEYEDAKKQYLTGASGVGLRFYMGATF